MKLGIFGGTFDPVHYGHLLVAECCREELHLDEVRWVPAAAPPHKPDARITDGHARADMLLLALSGYPEFKVDRRELKRSGPSYTVDTLTEFALEFPHAELYLIIGADSLRDFLTWRDPAGIAARATILACNRPGVAPITVEQIHGWVGAEIASRVVSVLIPGTDLSASDLRERARNGRSLRFRTPRAVEAFLTQHHLYQP
ncbi:MAG: nicotinate-nucleotide adenylyltransferase [Planctomycetota bacterium]